MRLPTYRIEGPFEDAYIDWYRRLGMSFAKAQERVERSIQEHASVGFRASLTASLTYYAKVYSQMYPERMRPVGGRKKTFSLQGYDAEVMQTVHVPGYRPCGTSPQARKLLMEMKP